MSNEDAWRSPPQMPQNGVVRPRTTPPEEKPVRHTNQLDYLHKNVRAVMRHVHAWPFRDPVDTVKLKIPDYFTVVSRPMDLGTVEKRLKNVYYHSASECIKDIEQVFKNCYDFNGPTNDVSIMCKNLEQQFREGLSGLPQPECVVPLKRKSVSSKARGSTGTQQSLNLPKTMPSKSQLLMWTPEETSFCYSLLSDLMSVKCKEFNAPFLLPVDVEGLGLKDYLKIVKTPMDLSTVKKRLDHREYPTPPDLYADLCLIWSNCLLYNAGGSPVHTAGRRLREYVEIRWEQRNESVKKQGGQPLSEAVDSKVLLSSVRSAQTLMQQVVDELKCQGDHLESFVSDTEGRVPLDLQSSIRALLSRCSLACGDTILQRTETAAAGRTVAPTSLGAVRKQGVAQSLATNDTQDYGFSASDVKAHRPMPLSQMRLLSQALGSLADSHSSQILNIVRKYEASPNVQGREMELDFQKMRPVTLRHLEAFVKFTTKDTATPKRTAQPVAAERSPPHSPSTSDTSVDSSEDDYRPTKKKLHLEVYPISLNEPVVSDSTSRPTPSKARIAIAASEEERCVLDRLLPPAASFTQARSDINSNSFQGAASTVVDLDALREAERAKREALGEKVDLAQQKEIMDNFEANF